MKLFALLLLAFFPTLLPILGQEASYSWKISGTQDDINGPTQTLTLTSTSGSWIILKDQPVNYSPLDPSDWKSYDVPSNALIACHAWWAGYGQTVYLTKDKSTLKIYLREIDEQAPKEKFVLKETINLKGQ